MNLEKTINKDFSLSYGERINFKHWIKSELAERTLTEFKNRNFSEDSCYIKLKEIFLRLRKDALGDLNNSNIANTKAIKEMK